MNPRIGQLCQVGSDFFGRGSQRFFCTMKDMRRLATRFEKLSRNFLAMIHIFAIRLWIN